MKKIAVFTVFITAVFAAGANMPVQRRGQPVSDLSENTSQIPVSARSAIRSTSVRSAVAQQVMTVSARSANVSPTSAPVVSARAGTMQKVMNSGTIISSANKNLVVNDLCKQKYDGCMDSFCMIENTNGGRCVCSNRKSELDKIQKQIQDMDNESYKMATEGVKKIEMGADADNAISIVNSTKQNINNTGSRQKVDLTKWDQASTDETNTDVFEDQQKSPIDGKVGDDLYNNVTQLCSAQIPECSNDISMIQMIYAQNIKADCTAYENDLKKQKNASLQKLTTVQQTMLDAAMDSLHIANKYDLGQCTMAFKKCMSDTAGCKDDFTGCVGIAAAENAKMSNNSKSSMKMVDINGSNTKISIAASTMDVLESKQQICMNVTNSCVAVKDQVWGAFLREVGPTLKTAELSAESNLRMNCISNISSCFQKACKDTIDPNDPDGSYDMCLSRPETVRSLCKVQIDPCISSEPLILNYVYARLSAMRVDSCTTEVKECLQSDDRCGSDYTKCVGLDTDTIIRMCPYDKLVGCQKVYSSDKAGKSITDEAVYDELATMVQGIMLNIDNNMLTKCQEAADAAMIKVCGSTDDCNGLAVDEGIGSRSLEYKICEYAGSNNDMSISYNLCRSDISQITDNEIRTNVPFASVLSGIIYWESVDFDDDGNLKSVDDYISKLNTLSDSEKGKITESEKARVQSEISSLQKSISAAIDTVESDPTVQYCMTGRQVQGMNDTKIGREGQARFPDLTKQMRLTIATSAIKSAKENYYKKYDELSKKMFQDYTNISERSASLAAADAKEVRRESARRACMGLAQGSVLPRSPAPPKGGFGKVLAATALVAGAVAAVALTGPLGVAVVASVGNVGITSVAVVGAASVTTAGIGLAGSVGKNTATSSSSSITDQSWNVCKVGADPETAGAGGGLMSSSNLNQWNYKQVVTTTFSCDNLMCNKCVKSQKCSNTKNPLFGSKYCKDWGSETEVCTPTQF